jgi:sterol desaturase/sphingolipid hydroxylase (fatty acid hydroxylase superfamily)
MLHPSLGPILIVAAFIVLLGLERLFPLRSRKHTLIRRLGVNIVIAVVALGTAAVVVRPTAAYVLDTAYQGRWGVVHLASLPDGARYCLAFLLMDLTFYYWHRANHSIPFLWRFHSAHHVDPELDVTTAYRFHFGEVALSALFRTLQISIIGMSSGTFAVYEFVFQVNTLFQHSNVRLPLRFERVLNTVLVTPRMHGVHHSQVFKETNSNYSVVFSWWDRLHRTLRLNVPQSHITIGIAGYSDTADNSVLAVLSMPFRRQRQYWRRPNGTVVQRDEQVTGTGMAE